MPTTTVKVLLFVSSYSPLAAIFAVLMWKSDNYLWLIPALIGLFGLCGLQLYLGSIRKRAPHLERVEDVKYRDADVTAYLVTYLVPFVDGPTGDPRRFYALVVFITLVMLLYVKSNMFFVNPILLLSDYHLDEVTLKGGRVALVLRKDAIRKGTEISVIQISGSMFLRKE